MKKVLIEGSIFSRQVASGISNYLSKLIEFEISRSNDPQIDYGVLLLEKKPQNIFLKDLDLNTQTFQYEAPVRFYQKIITGGFVDVDIFHSPYMFLPPKREGIINLLTVHDLINLRQPFSLRGKGREMMLRLAINRADIIICISNTTRNELINFFPAINPANVHVIYQGIDAAFTSPDTDDQFALPVKPFLLYVGARDGYKNFHALLSFYQQSRWRKDINILCVGGGPFNRAELSFIAKHNLQESITHAGFITTGQLKNFYRNAFALVYTSLMEGFGLPILEGMALGCPVICGNFSSMKEVAGGKAILVDDFTAESLDVALERAARFILSEREYAKEYARQFSWEKTATRTAALYRSL